MASSGLFCILIWSSAWRFQFVIINHLPSINCMVFTQWFQAVDQDGSNAIDAKELQQALALGNLHFSLAVCAHIIR